MSYPSPYTQQKQAPEHKGLKTLLWTLLPIFVAANVVLGFDPFPDWASIVSGSFAVAVIVGLVVVHLKSRDR